LNVELITKRDGKFAGVAIIEFETPEAATSALDKNEQEFFGRKMFLTYAKEEHINKGGNISTKPPGCTTVFIGNLPYTITEEEVQEFFSKGGEIKQIRCNPGDEFKCVGWVDFTDTNAPDEAVKLAGSDLGGRPVKVDYAAPRQKKQW